MGTPIQLYNVIEERDIVHQFRNLFILHLLHSRRSMSMPLTHITSTPIRSLILSGRTPRLNRLSTFLFPFLANFLTLLSLFLLLLHHHNPQSVKPSHLQNETTNCKDDSPPASPTQGGNYQRIPHPRTNSDRAIDQAVP